jgi:hypothetical protein
MKKIKNFFKKLDAWDFWLKKGNIAHRLGCCGKSISYRKGI